ncbi:hotdog domain-containing protein [Helicobacter pylori]|uniref:hotdog domain-containing protein n=1 Tax=Helicobacter pylori TaxID=210 RepID=UPI0002BA85C8|nr:hotdog domain-containing protein [Helicobacter pylori]
MQESVVHVDYDSLETCKNFKPSVGTELIVLEKDIAHARFKGNESMVYEENFVHAGFVLIACNYAALCALNKRHSVVVSNNINFYAPLELNQEVLIKAQVVQDGVKKAEIKIEAFVLDIQVLEGMIEIVVFDKKPFKLNFKEE